MNYFYTVLWFAAGLILVFPLSRENKIFRPIGGYFIFSGLWWLLNELFPSLGLFDGAPVWVFRGVSAVTLVLIGIYYFTKIRKRN